MRLRLPSPVSIPVFSLLIASVGCGSTGTNPSGGPPPPPPTLVSVSISPANLTLVVGATQQMTATAKYSDGSTAPAGSSASWDSSNSIVAGVGGAGLITAMASGSATASVSLNGRTGDSAVRVGANVATWHFDTRRSGLNPGEGVLTPQNVNPQNFGKLFSYLVDGYVYAQPLLVSNLTVNGGIHDVVFVATEKDMVYAFDAGQRGDGTPLWRVSLLHTGETAVTDGSIQPYEGITSTPAIDISSGTMYVVSVQTSSKHAFFRLHALDITNGSEKLGGPVAISASVPGTNDDSVNGILSLNGSCLQRSALLLADSTIFIGFGNCHSGWLLSYRTPDLTQTGVFNSSPNLNGQGAYGGAGGIWMGGGGPAADDIGNVYVTTGNGPYDGATAFGDSLLKFDSQLHLLDHFTPYDWAYFDCKDTDLASGGLLLIPGTTQALAGGKSGKLYLVNTTSLGGMQSNDAGATQTLWFEGDLAPPYQSSCTDSQGKSWTTEVSPYEIFGTPAFFNGSAYLGVTPTSLGMPGPLRMFPFTGQLVPGHTSLDSVHTASAGTTPFISSAGNTAGIVWMIDHGQPIQSKGVPTSAVLRAFDANLSNELYNSEENAEDAPGYGIKFTSPVVANGKVYLITGHDLLSAPDPQGELDVYGLKTQ